MAVLPIISFVGSWSNQPYLGVSVDLQELEELATHPIEVDFNNFNTNAFLPCGCTPEHIFLTMTDFIDFLRFINKQLHSRGMLRLESMLMPANFSSIVGEFMSATIPTHCPTIVKNKYHNGHPDLIPASKFPGDAVQHGNEGIEIKASRYLKGWQGHNPEDTWLMVFVFESNRPNDIEQHVPPLPFRFIKVVGAQLTKQDWLFAGRSETSRRTITASVQNSGFEKMEANWIYRDPTFTG